MKNALCAIPMMLGLFAWTSVAHAQTPIESAFASANRLYRDGKFKEAAQTYQKIVSQGIVSVSLWYNLGNAYVKTGELGKAVLAYERALRENPRDPEAKANLDYTRGLLADRTEEGGITAILGQLSVIRWLSWRENLWAFLLSYWAGALLGIAGILLRRRSKAFLAVALVLLGLAACLGSCLFFRSGLWSDPKAIVLAKEAEVRYGPVLGESTAFTLHEGCKVRVLRTEGDWAQIFFAKGKIGWVPSDAIERVE